MSLKAKLLRIGHFGLVADSDGYPVSNGDNWIRAPEAYDIGGVATGLKPVSFVSSRDVDGTLGTACSTGRGKGVIPYWSQLKPERRRLALEALRAAKSVGALYMPADTQGDGASVFLPKHFKTAAALHSYMSQETAGIKLSYYIDGLAFGYARRDIFAYWAGSEHASKNAGNVVDAAQMKAYKAQFRELTRATDKAWAATLKGAAFKKYAEALRGSVRPVLV